MTSHWEYSLSAGGTKMNARELYNVFVSTKLKNSSNRFSFEELVPHNLMFLAQVILEMHKSSDNQEEDVTFWKDGHLHSCYVATVVQSAPVYRVELLFNAKEK